MKNNIARVGKRTNMCSNRRLLSGPSEDAEEEMEEDPVPNGSWARALPAPALPPDPIRVLAAGGSAAAPPLPVPAHFGVQ